MEIAWLNNTKEQSMCIYQLKQKLNQNFVMNSAKTVFWPLGLRQD